MAARADTTQGASIAHISEKDGRLKTRAGAQAVGKRPAKVEERQDLVSRPNALYANGI